MSSNIPCSNDMANAIDGLSKICREAVVVNLETKESWHYSALYSQGEIRRAEKRRTRGSLSLSDVYNRGTQIAYLICWKHGLVAHILADRKPYQLDPDVIEAAYVKATRIKPLNIDKMGVL